MAIEKSLSSYCSKIKSENRKALVTYVTAGIKNWQEAIVACFENGADIVEVGLRDAGTVNFAFKNFYKHFANLMIFDGF